MSIFTEAYLQDLESTVPVVSGRELSAIIRAIDAAMGGGAGDHGMLAGLADDDHLQYVPVDGSRAFTGAASFEDDILLDGGVIESTGVLLLNAADNGAGDGSAAELTAGSGFVSGGTAKLSGGSGGTGPGGNAALVGGDSTSDDGGSIDILAGNAEGAGSGGSITIVAGTGVGGAGGIEMQTDQIERFTISGAGVVSISNLAGTGTRFVVVDDNGTLLEGAGV